MVEEEIKKDKEWRWKKETNNELWRIKMKDNVEWMTKVVNEEWGVKMRK